MATALLPATFSYRFISVLRYFGPIMLLLAATTFEKLQAVPAKVWLNLGMAVLIFIAAIIVLRKAAEMNKVVLSAIIFVILTSVGFNWVYARNEPSFMTPIIEPLAKFFPSAGKQAEKEKRVHP
jgi:uncharacterized membrane protein